MVKTLTQRNLKIKRRALEGGMGGIRDKGGCTVYRVDPLTSNRSPTWCIESTSDARIRVKNLFSVEIELPAPICEVLPLSFCIEFPRLSMFIGKLKRNKPENPRCAYLRLLRRTAATKDAAQLAFFKLESLQLRFSQYLEYNQIPPTPPSG
jgi:hypothetical protein